MSVSLSGPSLDSVDGLVVARLNQGYAVSTADGVQLFFGLDVRPKIHWYSRLQWFARLSNTDLVTTTGDKIASLRYERRRLRVLAGGGEEIGSIARGSMTPLIPPAILIRNGRDDLLFSVRPKCGNQAKIQALGATVGNISWRTGSALRNVLLYTSIIHPDVYRIAFPANATAESKLLLVAATLLLDFDRWDSD